MTNYSELSDQEALDRIVNHHDLNAANFTKKEIISPQDVLYWLDAFGDFSMAINLQPLPKDLPDKVYEQINKYDVLNDWLGTINEWECPLTGRGMYEFDWKHDWIYIDEYGDHHNYIEFLGDPGGHYWQADPDGVDKMVEPWMSRSFHSLQSKYNVRVYFGETNEVSGFTLAETVVRWDMEHYETSRTQWTDLWSEEWDPEELARAFALNNTREFFNEDWYEITPSEYDTSGNWRARHKRDDILEEWQRSGETDPTDPTRPDIDFTYIMKDGRSVWVPFGKQDEFIREVNDQIYFRTGQTQKLQDLRGVA